ncbi:MAG: PA14 domain-containing protein [Bacteroidota bacterium]
MNRLTPFVFLIIGLLSACAEEGLPESSPPKIAIQTELDFLPMEMGESNAWVGKAYLETPFEGEKIASTEGKEVLLLEADGNASFTSPFSHSSLELNLEFMTTTGAEGGILLQGAHKVYLNDNWGSDSPANAAGKIDEDAPMSDASLAPGLWQKLRLLYHNTEGGPVFDRVELNGYTVQENLAMGTTNPDAAPMELMVDKGAIAFRNIGYKLYGDKLPFLDGLSYNFYEIEGRTTAPDSIPDFSALEVKDSGQSDSLSWQVTEERRNYALTFEGNLNVPAEGEYMFELRVQGGAILYIDGKELINHDGETNYEEGSKFGKVSLTPGDHAFKLLYRKEHMHWRFGLGLFVEGPGIEKMPLHSKGSVYARQKPEPYVLKADGKGSLHRSYLMHKDEKLTHAISVGDAEERVHYSYDLDNASLLQMWGGEFLDVRQMWVGRGAEQLAVPMGAAIVHSGLPNFAVLPKKNTSWPEKLTEDGPLKFKGYNISESGAPIFRYALAGGEIQDHLVPAESGRSLQRSISLSASEESKAYVLLAKGMEIHEGPNGLYGVDDFNYYLEVDGGAKPEIRQTTHGQELIMALSPNSTISYSLIW